MYKALIVDDERMIRNGICKMVPWERLGVGEVFTADGGESALEIIRSTPPDILFTDIRMGEMNGLDLIEQVNRLHPGMRIVVLTGYDNFEYVRQCCRMNVQDFILKPTDEEELSRIVRAQVEELDRLRGAEQYQRVVLRAQGAKDHLELEQALRRLIGGGADPREPEELLERYRYRADQPMQAVLIVPDRTGGDWRDHADLLLMSIKNTCMELFDAKLEGITFEDGGKVVLALFCGGAFDEPLERMERLGGLLRQEFEFSPRIVMGGEVSGFGELAGSYRDALHLLKKAEPYQVVTQSGEGERRLRIFAETFEELKRAMLASTGNLEKVLRGFAAFTTAAEAYGLSDSMARRYCFELACSLYYSHVCEAGGALDNRLSALVGSLTVCSREEACKFTGSFLTQLLGGDEAESHEIVSSAKQYITDHLGEELSVSSIAERLYVTPNYFSRLFKRVTGEGCNEFIVRNRMEMAKSLLVTTDYKTGKIAEMAGYRDANYFSLAFKKYSGCSPTAYRESMRADSGGREPAAAT